jgi:hypothetical protein
METNILDELAPPFFRVVHGSFSDWSEGRSSKVLQTLCSYIPLYTARCPGWWPSWYPELLTLSTVSVWRPPDTTGAEHLTGTGAGLGAGWDRLNWNLARRRRRELYHCGDRSHAWGGKQIVPTGIYIYMCICVCVCVCIYIYVTKMSARCVLTSLNC